MNEKSEEYKAWLAQIFDRGSDRYGRVGPDIFSYFGDKLVEHAGLVEGSAVLDVACGRGAVLFPAYERVGPAGKVIGIDLSSKMVTQTRKEVGSRGLDTILVNQMDAEDLQFPAGTFDFVLCGLALFFFPDAQRTLMEIHRVLKPGGVFCTTTFGDDDSRWDVFGETIKTYKDKLKPVPQSDALSFNNDKEIVETLTEAGFKKIEIFSEDKEFYYANPAEWWASMWSHGMRALLERMGEETLEDFKKDCYNVVQRMAGEKGIPQLLRVLITRASRPAESDQIRI
jgi:ubiquinone/menaquinone biosynthesis C-methylase UbiE